ncbi:AFR211Cp [Eremothecium gossypii ATCC 10895]|uniref:Aspartate aminotransferase n=1 Tax=Eremothecium gossypii (strain ATCC 10895 / CBS 109.51 / FGSC 9923 / NRRL Y-1056) TaxID=284811 RepID=Q753W1_EREGS|nr:AFR211Cp [Eremothecium gossypii ATCC 10895]AAS53582.1 AFR211Cp [Eremothecium gossypii ATCC 10895]
MSLTAFNQLEILPPDALFDVKKRLTQDTRSFKVDLGLGAYRDENGKPWVLPCVREAEKQLMADPGYNHEYLGIAGLEEFRAAAARVLLGEDSEALAEGRVVSVQSISGTGALHVAAKLLAKTVPDATVYMSDPTWGNHFAVFETQGLRTATYPYWDAATRSLDMEGVLGALGAAPRGSVFVLHACAHNPTGLDPNEEQWVQILDAVAAREHTVLFDSAYQGFASGSLARDAYALRAGLRRLAEVTPVLVCQSFAKNIGMYGERVGALHVVLPRQPAESLAHVKAAVLSQLSHITRSELSNPPAYGAKIVTKVLTTPELAAQWKKDMITMSSRIARMRRVLRDRLVELGTPGNWDHIVQQCGMFSYTGLTKEMVARMEKDFAIYMVSSGRISIAGLNDSNVGHVANAIDNAVRHFSTPKL